MMTEFPFFHIAYPSATNRPLYVSEVLGSNACTKNQKSQETIFHPLTYLTYWGHSAQKHLWLIVPPVNQQCPQLWLDLDSCAPISLSLAARADCVEFPRGGMPPSGAVPHWLSEGTGAGAFHLQLQLGSAWRWANCRQREEKKRGWWRISLSLSLFHRKSHPSIIRGA